MLKCQTDYEYKYNEQHRRSQNTVSPREEYKFSSASINRTHPNANNPNGKKERVK